jgi:hypothetical protein
MMDLPAFETLLQIGFFALVNWPTWPVVIALGVLPAHWLMPILAGVVVALLVEYMVLVPLRETFVQGSGFPSGGMTLGTLLPGFVVGTALTFLVQRLHVMARRMLRATGDKTGEPR